MRRANSEQGRLLVRLPNWLGDLLMARPLLHSLRRARPEWTIVAAGPSPFLVLLGSEGLFDLACVLPGPPRVARIAAGGPLTLALVLPPSFSSAWYALRSGAAQRVGYASDWRSLLLTTAVTRPERGELHLSGEYLRLAAAAGIESVGDAPLPPLAVGEIGSVAPLLDELDLADAPYAVLAPGARYGPAKRWEAERFAALARRLAERGLAVVLCGGVEDRPTCERVAALAPGTRVAAGRTTLSGAAALCARARVVVSNDSGLAHLAAATGAPTVVLFGSTSSAWTAPLGDRVRIIQHAPVCAPCFQRSCQIGYACLRAISVDEVLAACERSVA